jgi:hypothetical protein
VRAGDLGSIGHTVLCDAPLQRFGVVLVAQRTKTRSLPQDVEHPQRVTGGKNVVLKALRLIHAAFSPDRYR